MHTPTSTLHYRPCLWCQEDTDDRRQGQHCHTTGLENKHNISQDLHETLSDNQAYAGLAEDTELRGLMAKVAQNKQWQTYFEDYEVEFLLHQSHIQLQHEADRTATIDRIYTNSGLPDVWTTDLEAVADKAKRDGRINTKL
jgi:hypothetical protein